MIWLGDSNRLVTTGFSKTSDRQICLWDSQNLETAIKTEVLDTSSGQLMPYYDQDTSVRPSPIFLGLLIHDHIRCCGWLAKVTA